MRRQPTDSDMVHTCISNAEAAAREEGAARARMEIAAAGTAEYFTAKHEARKAQIEQAHWREYATYFRKKLEEVRR